MSESLASWPWWLWGVGIACAAWAVIGPRLVRGRRRPEVAGQPRTRGVPMRCPVCESGVAWSDVVSMAPATARCPVCRSTLDLDLVGIRLFTALEMAGVFAVHVLAWQAFRDGGGLGLAIGIYCVGMLLVETSYYSVVSRDVILSLSTRRTCYVPRLGREGVSTTVGLSRFGGTPTLRAGETWPVCSSCAAPLAFVAQIDTADLPDATRWARWRELLQVFVCPGRCDRARTSAVRAIAVGQGESGERTDGRVVEGWDPLDDHPGRFEFAGDEAPIGDGGTRHGHKVGGWPAWSRPARRPECPRCSRPMDFVLQVALPDGVDGEGGPGDGLVFRCADRHVDEWTLTS